MKVLDTVYVPRPQQDESEGDKYIAFTLRKPWVAVDGDKLILPISLTERNGQTLQEPRDALLSQFGGHKLLTQLLLDLDGQPEAGDEFILEFDELKGFVIRSI